MNQNNEQSFETVLNNIREEIGNLAPGDKLCLVFEASALDEPLSVTQENSVSEEFKKLIQQAFSPQQAFNPRKPAGGETGVPPHPYEEGAARTDLDQRGYAERAAAFYIGPDLEYARDHNVNPAFHLLHAVLGIMSEAGELANQLKRHIIYQQPLDRNNVLEEIGDIEWYLAKGARCMGSNLEAVRDANIAKLQKRYPEKFSNEQAVNRDEAAERAVLDDHFDEEETRG